MKKICNLIFVLLPLILISCAHFKGSRKFSSKENIRPHHLMILVFDSMRQDYIDRFDLKNFKEFRSNSRNYANSYLGYMGAETAVSHLVIPTGRKPNELPWHDDIFFDLSGQLNAEAKGSFYNTGSLSFNEMNRLMKTLPESSYLPFVLKEKFPNTGVYAIGEKNYAAMAMGTPYADSIITLKKKKQKKPESNEEIVRCIPDGVNVPNYISSNSRFELECGEKYGTKDTYYPLDGSRMVPGKDGLGGDVWVTDAAFEVMNNEKWSGLFLTFGGIDKVMHMIGETEPGPRPSQTKDIQTEYDLEHIAKVADEQLGRILERLRNDGILEDTLIVITADHGAQTDKVYLGNGTSSRWGTLKNDSTKEVSDNVNHFLKAGDVAFSFQDTAIRVWMKQQADRKPVWQAMSEVKGVTEIYENLPIQGKEGAYEYRLVFKTSKSQTSGYRNWAEKHHLEILNAMAAADSPDLVGLLAEDTGFDLIGDHGGAQEKVQRIPLMLRVPDEKSTVVNEPIRLYELKDKIEKVMDLN